LRRDLLAGWLDRSATGQEHIGLLLPTSVGGALANLGVAFAGRTAVNLNFTAGDDSMSQAIAICGIRTILTSKAFVEKAKLTPREGMVYLEDVLPSFDSTAKALELVKCRVLPAAWLVKREQRPGSVAAIIFSSGSTGEPKGVALSHWNLISNCDAVAQVYTFTAQDSMLGVLPFFHSFGYTYNLWFPLLSGARAAYHPNPMDAKIIGELAEQHGSTFLLSTPTFCAGYTRKCTKEQFSKLRYALVGAEKLRESLAAAFTEKFGVPIYEGYGCTEMAPVVAVNGPDFDDGVNKQQGQRAGSVGRPIPGRERAHCGSGDAAAASEHGEEGLLLVDGPSRMLGYHAQAERTAKVMHDGFYVTGDIARMDADGFLYITDRLGALQQDRRRDGAAPESGRSALRRAGRFAGAGAGRAGRSRAASGWWCSLRARTWSPRRWWRT
jgi:acyl-[acyl-carrier-protein]-phospholipid O-acyltransferase / long-chain-fatty-acid--[acyl-carrier-protein] ligase